MKIENLRDKMLASHSEATTQEIECLKTYYDEADKHGHFDTYYKVWSTEKIEKLESQNKKLIEALKVYASDSRWNHGRNELEPIFILLGNETDAKQIARAVLKEVENE